MNLLLFEYATSLGIEDPEIFIEGKAMLKALLGDLQELRPYYLVSEKFQDLGENANSIVIKEDIYSWIERCAHNFDACLFIAPEENLELYKLTRLLESRGVKIIGANSQAALTCSDKMRTYNALAGKVPLIETYDGNIEFDKKMVLKPVDGVACQGIRIINSREEFDEAIRLSNSQMILQEFIEGEAASASLLSNGDRAVPLCLNKQEIKISNNGLEYKGGCTPFEHDMMADALKIARKAVESIEGLRGYVGVDLILADEIYVVELNSRITTPYVALRKLIDINLGKAIFEASEGILPQKWSINGFAEFKKEAGSLKILVD